MAIQTQIKPIKPTVVTETKYIDEILSEALRKPTKAAMNRNRKAAELVQRLRGL